MSALFLRTIRGWCPKCVALSPPSVWGVDPHAGRRGTVRRSPWARMAWTETTSRGFDALRVVRFIDGLGWIPQRTRRPNAGAAVEVRPHGRARRGASPRLFRPILPAHGESRARVRVRVFGRSFAASDAQRAFVQRKIGAAPRRVRRRGGTADVRLADLGAPKGGGTRPAPWCRLPSGFAHDSRRGSGDATSLADGRPCLRSTIDERSAAPIRDRSASDVASELLIGAGRRSRVWSQPCCDSGRCRDRGPACVDRSRSSAIVRKPAADARRSGARPHLTRVLPFAKADRIPDRSSAAVE